MSRTRARLVILARYPRTGEVKTRLIPTLTAEEAVALHDRLTRHTLRRALAVQATGDASVEVRTDAAFTHAAREWLGPGFAARYQGEGDLGDRIRLAFGDAFARSSERVVVIGSDCPRLTSAHIRSALDRLAGVDVVLGPADDGGYYLVALRRESAKRAVPVLFSGVPWSTEDVLARTLAIAEDHGLSYALLEHLPDVDRPEDLADAELALAEDVFAGAGRAADATRAVPVSAVIPALDDAGLVAAAVASALAGGVAEVIVVDGGSRDATREVASTAGARVVESAPGRARQLNAGAAEATGGVLLFSHADTLLPPDAAALARETLARPGVVAGAFGFSVERGARWGRLISAVGKVRSRVGVPYGDQGLFVSAAVFRDMGGYPDMPALEDLEFSLRLERLGRVVTLKREAVTSARAWTEHGLVRSTAVNTAAVLGYRLGVSPERIARWRATIAPAARTRR